MAHDQTHEPYAYRVISSNWGHNKDHGTNANIKNQVDPSQRSLCGD